LTVLCVLLASTQCYASTIYAVAMFVHYKSVFCQNGQTRYHATSATL